MGAFTFVAAIILVLTATSSKVLAQSEAEQSEIVNSPSKFDCRLADYNSIYALDNKSYFVHGNEKYITHYNGLYGVINNKILNYYHKLWNDSIISYYNHSNLTPNAFQRYINQYNNWENDARDGQWWDRSVFDSFSLEGGGAPLPKFYEVGQTFEIFKVWAFSLTNTGRINVGDISFHVNNAFKIDNRIVLYNGSARYDNIQLSNININFRPNFIIRPSLNAKDVVSHISFEVRCKISDNAKNYWAFIILKLDGSPSKNEFQTTMDISFAFW